MGFPDRSRFGRARLAVELLEDRTTPAKLDDLASMALPELVATGAVAGDRVNVVMNAETNNAADAAALAATPFASSVKALGFGIYSVTLTADTDLGAAVTFYSSLSGVASAAPDEIVGVQVNPNDPSFTNGSLYGLTKIGAPTAWNTTTGSSSFVVAVIDTGVDYNHPDLAANMWTNAGEIAGNGVDDDSNGYVDDLVGWDFVSNDNNPLDDNNHGTHVAGTIGAVGNNSVGVVGVNWSVKIMALKFLGANGSGATSGAVSALDYAVTNGAKVSNNSWGGGGFSTTMDAALTRARLAGHIFVAAAGNSAVNIDTSPSYPASYTANNVVSVAATDSNDALASFSNFGATAVDLAAPGVSILSTTRNNTYSSFSGTSMATPHVAGAIALYWSANPTLSYTDVINKLKSSVTPVAGLTGKVATGGRLNVANMFATTSPPSPPSPPVVAAGPKVVSATYNDTFSKVRVTFDKAINASTFSAAASAADVSLTGPNGAIAVTGVTPVGTTGTQFDVSFAPQTTAGNYSMVIGPDIRDTAGNQMNQNGNGLAGETTDRFTATGSLRTFSATGLPLAIQDHQTTTSTIDVSENVKITDLNVKVSLTHTYDRDLVITLTSPVVNGVSKTVTLFNRRGGSGDNLTNTIFNDEATVAIANGAAPFNGSFRADGLLSAFDGLSTLGKWTLKVSDRATTDTGSLTAWSLSVIGTIGSGGSAQTLGFLDEPTFANDEFAFADEVIEIDAFEFDAIAGDAFEFDAVPLAVASSESVREMSSPLTVIDDTTSDDSSMSWLSPEAARREYEVRSDEATSYTNRDWRPAARDDFSEPHAAALATLYFPPASGDSDSDSGDFFSGDAE